MSLPSPETAYIVYDGQCPFCSAYVRLLRLRQALGTVILVDARAPQEHVSIIQRIEAAGLSLDEGMALVRLDRIAHGADCLQELALMSTRSGLFNRLNAWIFRSPRRAKILYPILRAGRNLTLRILGIKKLR